jgi:hypothetical protein
MAMKNIVFVCCSLALASSSLAQSAFEGMYGQISTGYEKNTASSAQLTGTDNGGVPNLSNSANPSSGSSPLVLGLGYTFLIKDKYTLGLGVDYSALSQDTSVTGFYYPGISSNVYDYKYSISNRVNLFIAPGFAVDRDKLIYVKFGYSTQNVQYSQTNCCSTPSNKAQVNGYGLGLGYKQMIANGFYGFAEANYYSYSSAGMASTYSDGPGGAVSSSPKFNAYNFLLGLGYRF